MSDKKKGFGRHRIPEPVNNSVLGSFIKINNDIPAENYIHIPQAGFIIEVMIVKTYPGLDILVDFIAAFHLVKVFF